jgi:hypothetical protein
LIVRLQVKETLSRKEIQAFLKAADGVGFEGRNREEIYEWVNQTLQQQRYQG